MAPTTFISSSSTTVASASIMSNSISSTVEGEQFVRSPTLLQNIQPSSASQASTLGMCSLTLSGMTLISVRLNASSNEFRNAWILDFGAINHMTHNPNQFKTYLPCPSNRKIIGSICSKINLM